MPNPLANVPDPQGTPLADPHHTRADLALVRRAIRQRWEIPDVYRALVPQVMADILADKKSERRDRIGAAKVMVAMEALNAADDHAEDKNARLDDGKATERVTVVISTPRMLE